MNSAGFAIMNSASYNLNPEDDKDRTHREGPVMKEALQNCETVDDFEAYLKKQKRPMGLEANFGVIDAKGNAAFFEVSNTDYVKVDADDPKQAPDGYLIRSNHSKTGRKDEGLGYIRLKTAEKIFAEAIEQNDLTPRFLAQEASRCLKHALTKQDLQSMAKKLSSKSSKYVFFHDFIPRQRSSSVMVLQGVRPGEDPALATVWTMLGFPLTASVVPTWVAAGPDLPTILQGSLKHPAPMCSLSLKLKAICFPIKRGSGPYYLKLAKLLNRDGTGILQRLEPIENRLFEKVDPMLTEWNQNGFNPAQARDFYRWVDDDWFTALQEAAPTSAQ